MQANIRQRLVGAFVLICLSAILWPVLFSTDINPQLDRTSRIPPAPQFEKFSAESPEKPVKISEVVTYQPDDVADQQPLSQIQKQADTVPNQQNAPAVNKAAPVKPIKKLADKKIQKPEITEQGLPNYWALQLGSFSQKLKASQLKQALLAKGYKVDTRTVNTANGKMIRVYVGPKLDKSILQRAKPTIDKEFNVQSMLVRFTPK